MSDSSNKRTKEWMIIVAAVIVIHAVLFLSVRPTFFSMFKKTISSAAEGERGEPFISTAMLTIPIEIEEHPQDREQEPVQEPTEPAKEEPRKLDDVSTAQEQATSADPGKPRDAPVTDENLIGESPETLPHNIGPEEIMIPPRAVEITWPDTRKLSHCLGHHIDMRVHVDEKGTIVSIEPVDTNHPPDCVEAAVESAREIVFEPGRVDGKPAAMWTLVRIDFRKKK